MSRATVIVIFIISFFISTFIGVACSPLGPGFGVATFSSLETSAIGKHETKVVFVSDLAIESISNGWGPIESDMSNGEKAVGDGRPLTIAGRIFHKGIGVHAPSKLILAVPSHCYSFRSSIGVDDEAGAVGSVVFQIKDKDQVLMRSDVMKAGEEPQSFSVDVVGGSQVSLEVEDGGDGNAHDHADWANAHFVCADMDDAPPPVGPTPPDKNPDKNPSPTGNGSGQCTAPTEPAYYVAADGSDTADGTFSRPFRTLVKARDAMRSGSLKKTFLRGGTHILTQTLELTSLDNDANFESYPCEKAVISGGRRLTSFKSEGNGIFSLQTDSITDLDLFIGDVRQRPATSGSFNPAMPFESGWFFVEALVGDGKRAYQFKAGDLTPADMIPGVLAQSFAWDRQADSIVEVDRIDFTSRTLYLKSDVRYAPKTGTFRLLNNPKFLRNPGEFTWAKSESRLYVKPKNPSTFESEAVTLPQVAKLITLTGTERVSLRYLSFRDVPHNGQAIALTNSNNNRIGANLFENVGTAVWLSQSSNNMIAGNQFRHLGSSGVDLTIGSNNNKIYANDIRYVGEVNKHIGGVMGHGVFDNWIAHNQIQYSARYGISIKTWDAATRNERNTIEYNKILDVCQETGDGGAIEMLGRLDIKTGNIIRGNYIERYGGLGASDGGFYATKGFGIYLDDKTGGVLVTGNFVKSSPGMAHIYVHAGDYNTIENNFGILSGEDLEFIRLERTIDYASSAGTIVRKNIIYYESQTSDYSFYSTGGEAMVDQNLLFRTGKYRDGGGGDVNSVIADPQFTNPAAGDYSLKPSSPALQLGIQDLEWGKMGLDGYKASADRPKFW